MRGGGEAGCHGQGEGIGGWIRERGAARVLLLHPARIGGSVRGAEGNPKVPHACGVRPKMPCQGQPQPRGFAMPRVARRLRRRPCWGCGMAGLARARGPLGEPGTPAGFWHSGCADRFLGILERRRGICRPKRGIARDNAPPRAPRAPSLDGAGKAAGGSADSAQQRGGQQAEAAKTPVRADHVWRPTLPRP